MANLDDRIAIVTGAETGIGAATARALGAAGCAVAINYLEDEASATKVRDAILAAGARAIIVAGDVGSEADVARLFATCGSELGVPSIVVNNAGTNSKGMHVGDMTLEQWDEMLRVNLRVGSHVRTRSRAVARASSSSSANASAANARFGDAFLRKPCFDRPRPTTQVKTYLARANRARASRSSRQQPHGEPIS